ncbi:MAG: bifunctional riboflavin kinase/FAD synthetase [Paludibacter sp.]|nr:bifunctional riboflavin kinase/FAD synthetase [Paludibacter sp.]
MNIIYPTDKYTFIPSVATVGFFDGLHAGHRFLIEELKSLAKAKNQESIVVTFATHPRKVLNSDFQPELLNTLSEKLNQLETTGIDICVVLDFTVELAQLSALDFIKSILKEQLNVQTLLVGHDHRFGHNRAEGFNEYKKYGDLFGIEVIKAQQYNTIEDKHISSSEIRIALQHGEIEHANRLLTYNYSVRGKVIDGFKVGRKIGFPTANILPDDANKLIPPLGVYAVRVHWNGNIYKGMMNIGTRPTLANDLHVSLEVNIFDFDQDIYNQIVEVEFIKKIRDEQKFKGVEELIQQLNKDKQTVLDLY